MGSGVSSTSSPKASDACTNNNGILIEQCYGGNNHNKPKPLVRMPSSHFETLHRKSMDKRAWRNASMNLSLKRQLNKIAEEYRLLNTGGCGRQYRMGRNTVTIDTRLEPTNETAKKPRVIPGKLWQDPDFSESIAFRGLKDEVFYKRPKDICKNPALYTYGTTRFDIVQGRVGTCYLLSVIASLAEKPDLLNQIIVSQNYDPASPDYDGVFHVRFWKFGKWVDVYIDDRIPVFNSRDGIEVWSAKSWDPNELWVTLLEKAYTKVFGGSYSAVYGGTASDAFTNLTGGVTELFDLVDIHVDTRQAFHQRISNALQSGSLVTCTCKPERDRLQGMVGAHAYTLSGSGSVTHEGQCLDLFRIRNTWGAGEWNGPWSDYSEEWKKVSAEAKEALQVQGKVDGEFWMNLEDFFNNFSTTVICNFTPDFNQDGAQDNLDCVCTMIGEWRGPTAAGQEATAKLNNPKFEMIIPDNCPENTCQVLLQCLQDRNNKKKEQFEFVRTDLYLIDEQIMESAVIYNELTNYLKYQGGREVCYRYNLAPGRYLILPNTLHPCREKQFIIRTFSAIPLTCREVKTCPNAVIKRCDFEFQYQSQTYFTPKAVYIPGSWRRGQNAGGQIKHKHTFSTNPQYQLKLSGRGLIPLSITLIQESSGRKLGIGLKLWKANGLYAPLDMHTVYSVWRNALSTTDNEAVFMEDWEVEGTYLLDPGEYILIVFTDKPNDEKTYTLCLATAENCTVQRRAYHK